jgi:hypothetical protein
MPVGPIIYGFLLDKLPSHLILASIGAINLVVTLFFIKYASSEAYEPKTYVADLAVAE